MVIDASTMTEGSVYHLRMLYTIPIEFCHSYDPTEPIEGDNLGVCQGGLLGGLLDNCMSLAIGMVTGGRFRTTVQMSTRFLKPTRSGKVYAQAVVENTTGRTAYARVFLFSDLEFSDLTATADCVGALRVPPPKTTEVVVPAKAKL